MRPTPDAVARLGYMKAWRAANREQVNARHREWVAKNRDAYLAQERARWARDRMKMSGRRRRWVYGITPEAFAWLLEQQGGACAACERDATAVDHDHSTGLPRALLCNRCNLTLGHLERDAAATRRLLQYATAHS